MNCKINFTKVCEITNKCLDNTKTFAKKALSPICQKLSDMYFEYDVDINGKAHLTPEKVDEAGNEQNVISTSHKGKVKLSAKDILCLLAFVAVALSILKRILKKMIK